MSAGNYQLEVRVEGFQPFSQTVLLGHHELHMENVALHIAAAVQHVDVRDQATQVATEAATSALKLTERQF